MRLLVVFAALCCVHISARAAALLDAASPDEALTMGAVDFRHIDEMRNVCASVMPEHKTAIHGYALAWLDRNEDEFKAIYSFTKTAPESWKSARDEFTNVGITTIRALSKAEQMAYCEYLFGRVESGEQDIARKTPNVSRFLAQYLINHPLSPLDVEMLNFRAGCEKQYYNRVRAEGGEFDLDRVTSLCQCLWDTTEQNTTAEERKLSNEYARRREPIDSLPHVQRIAPLLQTCFISGQSP